MPFEGWNDGLVVKSTGPSSRGPGFEPDMATIFNSSTRGSDALLWPLQEAGIQQCTDMHAGKRPPHTQTVIKNKQASSTLKPQLSDIVEEEEFLRPSEL